MAKKICITGTVEVPQEIRENLAGFASDNVEFKRVPDYQFHRKESGYTTKALIHIDGCDYLIAQEMKGNSHSIGYFGSQEPDKKTKRKIKKIAYEKFF